MAEKTASLRLDLKSDTFKKGLKEAEGAAAASAGRMGAAFQHSMKGGLDAIGGLASKLKSGLGMLAGPLAGIGLGVLVKDAMKAEGMFRRLGFAIKTAGEAGVDMTALKKDIRGIAIDTGIAVEDLITSFSKLSRVGGTKFAKEALKGIANQSLATGDSVETLTEITTGMHEQFGVAGKEAVQGLAMINKAVVSSDVSIEEYASYFERVGAVAKNAGASGVEGIGLTIGMLEKGKEATGSMRKGMSALTGVLDELGTTAGRQKVYMKLGIHAKAEKGTALDAMQEVMKATGGQSKKLEKAFAAPQVHLMTSMGEAYGKAYSETTGDLKTKTKAGIDAFNASIQKAGDAARLAADMEAEAQKAKQEASTKIDQGMEELKAAIAQPEVIAAFKEMSSVFPALAHAFAEYVPVITKHLGMLPAALATLMFVKGSATTLMQSLLSGGAGATSFGASAVGAGTQAAGLGTNLLAAAGGAIVFAAAAAAMTLAVDQATKFLRELKQHKQDVKDERENLLANAEKQGKIEVEREKPFWDWKPEDFMTGGKEYLSRGKNGEVVTTNQSITGGTGKGVTVGGNMSEESLPDYIKRQIQYGTPAEERAATEEQKVKAYQATLGGGGKGEGNKDVVNALARPMQMKIVNVPELAAAINKRGAGAPVPGASER